MLGLTATGWTPSEDLDVADWTRVGRQLGQLARSSPWWVADWLLYAEERWDEDERRAATVSGYDRKTLRNLRYVARRIPPSLRRDGVSFTHHALLAAREPEEITRWLDLVKESGMTVEDLRFELRSAERGAYRPRAARSHTAGEAVQIGGPTDAREVGGPIKLRDGDGGPAVGVCPSCGHPLSADDVSGPQDGSDRAVGDARGRKLARVA
jgi:hypothetical protein